MINRNTIMDCANLSSVKIILPHKKYNTNNYLDDFWRNKIFPKTNIKKLSLHIEQISR